MERKGKTEEKREENKGIKTSERMDTEERVSNVLCGKSDNSSDLLHQLKEDKFQHGFV